MPFRPWKALVVAGLVATGLPVARPQSSAPPATQTDAGPAEPPISSPAPAEAAISAGPEKKTFTVPAGTKVLLQLRSSINTKSAAPGDGVYLASTFPVVVGNRVLIPAGVYVQGVVDRVERAGHLKGRAQLDMHFTSMIFPNGTVVEIPGLVNSLPGASKQKIKKNGEGTIEEEGDKTRNMGKIAEVTVPAGTTGGAIGGAMGGHPLGGTLEGMGAGLAAAGIISMFTRGADVDIQAGSQVEMVLQRPLVLEEDNLNAGAGTPAMVPAANQPKPMQKPHRAQVLCPAGGLGCQ